MTQPLTRPVDDDRCAIRHLAYAELQDLYEECRVLETCLHADVLGPGGGRPWLGVANAMYRARLSKIQARVAAALRAVEAATLALHSS